MYSAADQLDPALPAPRAGHPLVLDAVAAAAAQVDVLPGRPGDAVDGAAILDAPLLPLAHHAAVLLLCWCSVSAAPKPLSVAAAALAAAATLVQCSRVHCGGPIARKRLAETAGWGCCSVAGQARVRATTDLRGPSQQGSL